MLNKQNLNKETIMERKIKRALISVSDKSEIEDIGKFLSDNDIEILSTGGTAKTLRDADINIIDVSEFTGSPEVMDGRVKTLHPKIHAGLLACLDNDEHVKAMQENNYESIDLVIVNLYPFEETVAKGASFEQIIENIDIGGPSMVRSAAKNFNFTTIITSPSDYNELIEEIDNNSGATSLEFRKKMAMKAFSKTASYDSAISSWFAKQESDDFPETINFSASLKQTLRYGENPHQKAAFYSAKNSSGITDTTQIQGKELSYNNINDSDAAFALVSEFEEPAAVIIKHANPCGTAIDENISLAFDKALASDPVSAFGGIMAFNRIIEKGLAEKISSMFVEAIIAPDISDEAKEIFAKKKNLRVLLTQNINADSNNLIIKSVGGGFLLQETDGYTISEKDLEVVTKRQPTDEEISDLLFAFKVCKHVKSNAIILAKNLATVGIGAGQMSRVDSSKIAAIKASECKDNPDRAKGSVIASDAFFPFADGLIQAAEVGVSAVIQPGGSIRDDEVIDAANKHDLAMVFTGKRHFKH